MPAISASSSMPAISASSFMPVISALSSTAAISTTMLPFFSTTDWTDSTKDSSFAVKGRGIQNRSFGSMDKKDGDSGLSALTNVELVGKVKVSGSKGRSSIGVGEEAGVGEETGLGEEAGVGEVTSNGEEAGVGKLPPSKSDSNLAFSDRIIDSVNGPWFFDSETNSREQDGIGSGSEPDSMLALASVNAKVSVQLIGKSKAASGPPLASTTWPDCKNTVNDKQTSSFADKLTLIEEAAIFDTLKTNKKEKKILCSDSNYAHYKF